MLHRGATMEYERILPPSRRDGFCNGDVNPARCAGLISGCPCRDDETRTRAAARLDWPADNADRMRRGCITRSSAAKNRRPNFHSTGCLGPVTPTGAFSHQPSHCGQGAGRL